MTTAAVLGLLAGVVSVLDGIPYIRDTLRGATRPHRGTWLIWSSLALVALLSQWADGGTWSLVMVAVQAALTMTIFGLSVTRGEGGLSWQELLMLAIAASGLVGWYSADNPAVATCCVVVADAVGAAMMVPKTWRDPGSETLIAFVWASVAGVLSSLAVASPDVSLLIYPVYFALANGLIGVIIVVRRRHLARLPSIDPAAGRPG
jgi:hypothetical protein